MIYNSTKAQTRARWPVDPHVRRSREEIEEVYAGDIAAVLGFKESFTGDTLCDQHNPIVLENITFPEPVVSCGHRAQNNC